MRQGTGRGRARSLHLNVPGTVYRWMKGRDSVSLLLLDLAIALVAWMLGFLAGFESSIPSEVVHLGPLVLGVPVVIQIVVNRVAGLYGPVWRYASVEEGARVIVAVVVGSAASTVAVGITSHVTRVDLPIFTAPPVATLMLLLGFGGVRFQSRLFALERQRERGADTVRALIVGAGGPGAVLAHELAITESGRGVRVVGFVDDDLKKRRSVRGIPVLGDTSCLEELCEIHHIDQILIALPETTREGDRPVVEAALRTSAQVKVLGSATGKGSGLLRDVRDLDLTDLLGREPSPVDCGDIAQYLRGATVLVTGAGGSIGSEISRQVAGFDPGRLLLLDRDETLLHDVAVGPLAQAETVLLDIRDYDQLSELIWTTRPDVVFHAAANKHVPILERYPEQAVRTNVLATWWLANLAAESGCRHFVNLSTDKAANPCSVMGATKRVAEQIVVGVGHRFELPYVAVRFGNVLGSRGSVVPTFMRQILEGGPVTVTSAEMTRYFMTTPEAVSLVLQAGAMASDGKVFLLDMGEPASILKMARQMIRLAGLRPDEDVAIEITGLRPGERLHEQLHDEAEEVDASGHPSISGLRPKVQLDWECLRRSLDELERACGTGEEAVRQALVEMLRRGGVDCRLQPAEHRDVVVSPRVDEVLALDLELLEAQLGHDDSSTIDLRDRSNGNGHSNGTTIDLDRLASPERLFG